MGNIKKKVAELTQHFTPLQSFAICELQHALMDGLFEPSRRIKDGDLHFRRIERVIKIESPDPRTGRTYEDTAHLSFIVPLALNPQAETILLAIIKLSGMQPTMIEPSDATLPWFETAEGEVATRTRVEVTCTQYQLLKEAGMTTGKHDYQMLEYYLKLMARVIIEWESKMSRWGGSCHLLEYALNKEDGRLTVQLNWRLAGAILGDYYTAKIDLTERLALQKDASQTLHRWLSAHLWEGKSEFLLYETLLKHIWTQEATAAAQRKRLQRLKQEILPEMAQLPHWTVKMLHNGAHITHHKQKAADQEKQQ